MGTFPQLFKLNGTAWSLIIGLLLAGLLSGCHTPLIDIDVQVTNMAGACPPGGGGGGPIPTAGCSAKQSIPQQEDAVVAGHQTYNTATSHYVTTTNTYFCQANSTPCNANPGSSSCPPTFTPLKKCVTLYTPNAGTTGPGSCSCVCPP